MGLGCFFGVMGRHSALTTELREPWYDSVGKLRETRGYPISSYLEGRPVFLLILPGRME